MDLVIPTSAARQSFTPPTFGDSFAARLGLFKHRETVTRQDVMARDAQGGGRGLMVSTGKPKKVRPAPVLGIRVAWRCSLPQFMNFKLFGKAISAVNITSEAG